MNAGAQGRSQSTNTQSKVNGRETITHHPESLLFQGLAVSLGASPCEGRGLTRMRVSFVKLFFLSLGFGGWIREQLQWAFEGGLKGKGLLWPHDEHAVQIG